MKNRRKIGHGQIPIFKQLLPKLSLKDVYRQISMVLSALLNRKSQNKNEDKLRLKDFSHIEPHIDRFSINYERFFLGQLIPLDRQMIVEYIEAKKTRRAAAFVKFESSNLKEREDDLVIKTLKNLHTNETYVKGIAYLVNNNKLNSQNLRDLISLVIEKMLLDTVTEASIKVMEAYELEKGADLSVKSNDIYNLLTRTYREIPYAITIDYVAKMLSVGLNKKPLEAKSF